MDRHFGSSEGTSTLHMSHASDHYGNDTDDVKFMETDAAIPSTVDSSSLGQAYNTPFNSPVSSHHPVLSRGKGLKKMKKSKNDDDDAHSQSGDEEIDIDKYVTEDTARISVKILRKIIPKLRIACYFSNEQVSGKRKLKHLWDERPADWPSNISFKDPNNALKETRKPGKDELNPMYEFLRKKYLDLKNCGQSPPKLRVDVDHHHYHQPHHQHQLQQQQQQQQQQQHVSFQSPPVTTETAVHNTTMTYFTPHQPSSDDGQLAFSAVPSSVKSMVDDGKWLEVTLSSPQSVWQPIPNHLSYPSEEKAVLAPTRPEHVPHAVIQQQHMVSSYGGTSQPVSQDSMALVVVNGGRSPTTRLPQVEIPAPVEDIYRRLTDKQRQVASIAGNGQEVVKLLHGVQQDVIDSLYSKLSSSETRMCLMFLDAAHQYEALLDVIVVLGQMDIELLANGCQEIINKFNRDCTPVLMIPGVIEHRLLNNMSRLTGGGHKSVFDSSLEKQLYGIVLGGDASTKSIEDDPKMALHLGEQLSLPTDIKTLGISQRPGQEQGLIEGFNFIQKRPTLPSVNDDEPKQIDDFLKDVFSDTATTDNVVDLTEQPVTMSSETVASHQTVNINLMTSDTDDNTNSNATTTEMECDSQMLDDVFDVIFNKSVLASSSEGDESLGSELSSSSYCGTSLVSEQQCLSSAVSGHLNSEPRPFPAASCILTSESQWSLSNASGNAEPHSWAGFAGHTVQPSSQSWLGQSPESQSWANSCSLPLSSWAGRSFDSPLCLADATYRHIARPSSTTEMLPSSWADTVTPAAAWSNGTVSHNVGRVQSTTLHASGASATTGPFVPSTADDQTSALPWPAGDCTNSGACTKLAIQHGETAQCVPSARMGITAPIPLHVSSTSMDEFDVELSRLTPSGRRSRQSRGSTSRTGRSGIGVERNARRN